MGSVTPGEGLASGLSALLARPLRAARFSFGFLQAGASSLRVKLILLVLLGAIPPLGAMMYTAAVTLAEEREEARAKALALAREASAIHARLPDETREMLADLAQMPPWTDPVQCNRILLAYLRVRSNYENVAVVRPNGEVVCRAYPTQGWVSTVNGPFVRALDTHQFSVGDYEVDAANGDYTVETARRKTTVGFALPVLDAAGRVEMVLVAVRDMALFGEMAADDLLPQGTTVTVFDRNGTIVAHDPDSEKWVGRSVQHSDQLEDVVAQNREGSAEGTCPDGVPCFFAFMPLKEQPGLRNLYVTVGIPTAVAFGYSAPIRRSELVGLGLAAVLAMVGGWIGSEMLLLRRVRSLVGATQQVRSGDLSARIALTRGKGELSQLAAAFDAMTDALESRERESQKAEHEREESRARLAGIVASAMDAIITFDGEQRVVLFNAAAERMFGCSAAEANGRSIDTFIPSRAREAHRQHVRRFSETGGTSRAMGALGELSARRMSGEEFPIEASISQVEIGGRRLFTVILRDITERLRAEESLRAGEDAVRRARDELELRVQQRTAALARASETLHRLNLSLEQQAKRIALALHDEAGQVLTAAHISLAEAARELPPPAQLRMAEVRGHLDRIEDQLRRLSHELRPRILDDLGLVPALQFLAQGVAKRRGITVTVEAPLPKRLPAGVETTLYQLVQEALTNVGRHAQATRADVRLEQEPRTLRCAIVDDGVGFDATSALARSGGHGLGLVGIRDRLQALDGTLHIHSSPGLGTELVIMIPLEAA